MIFTCVLIIAVGAFLFLGGLIGISTEDKGVAVFCLALGAFLIYYGGQKLHAWNKAAPPKPEPVEVSPRLKNNMYNADAVLRCPKCGCTSIQTVANNRRFGILWLLFGWWISILFGTGKYKNICQMCGYKWTPGK